MPEYLGVYFRVASCRLQAETCLKRSSRRAMEQKRASSWAVLQFSWGLEPWGLVNLVDRRFSLAARAFISLRYSATYCFMLDWSSVKSRLLIWGSRSALPSFSKRRQAPSEAARTKAASLPLGSIIAQNKSSRETHSPCNNGTCAESCRCASYLSGLLQHPEVGLLQTQPHPLGQLDGCQKIKSLRKAGDLEFVCLPPPALYHSVHRHRPAPARHRNFLLRFLSVRGSKFESVALGFQTLHQLLSGGGRGDGRQHTILALGGGQTPFQTLTALFYFLLQHSSNNQQCSQLPQLIMRKAVALGVSLGSAGFLLSDKYQRAAVLNFVRVGGAAVKMAFIYSLDLEDSHRRAARALFNAFLANGGLFIKFGQLIAGLDVIVPDAYREVFSGIFKGKQAMSLTEVANAFQQSTKLKFMDCFEKDSLEYLSSASIAEVYRARLKNGDPVVIKLQHQGLRQSCRSQIQIIKFFIECGERLFPGFRFKWFGKQLQTLVPVQLDFEIEASNCEKACERLSKFKGIRVPRPLRQYSSKTILVSQFADGQRLDSCINRLNEKEAAYLSQLLSESFCHMIFDLGWVHADPHLANFIYDKNKKQLVVLDHALYQQLSQSTRASYGLLWHGMLTSRQEEIELACKGLGKNLNPRLFSEMISARPLDHVLDDSQTLQWRMLNRTQEQKEWVQSNAAKSSKSITVELSQMDRELFLIFKVNQMVRQICSQLGHPESFVVSTLSACNRNRGRLSALWQQARLRVGLLLFG